MPAYVANAVKLPETVCRNYMMYSFGKQINLKGKKCTVRRVQKKKKKAENEQAIIIYCKLITHLQI